MFKNLEQFLTGAASLEVDANGAPSDRDLQICTAVLLLQMACVDEHLTKGEIDSIVRVLDKQFVLEHAVAGDLLEVADFLRRDRAKLDEIVAVINKRFSEKQKQTIIAMLWRVMNADGSVSKLEAYLAAEIAGTFGLSPDQVAEAQALVTTTQV